MTRALSFVFVRRMCTPHVNHLHVCATLAGLNGLCLADFVNLSVLLDHIPISKRVAIH
jgi:hypothetical protein